MAKVKYSNISIPDKLAHAVDEYIKEHPELDLRSRAQVVSFALRLLLVHKDKKPKKE
jgi:metal-responsive CopG/Arc/MetJ family transcriptional regulator